MKVNLGKYVDDGDRTVEVEIHDYDTWSLDHTLAIIIHPALVRFKEKTCGVPYTMAEDGLPEHGPDDYSEARWGWILDQMIYAMQMILEVPDALYDDPSIDERVKMGTLLFGKYFRALWW